MSRSKAQIMAKPRDLIKSHHLCMEMGGSVEGIRWTDVKKLEKQLVKPGDVFKEELWTYA